MYGRWMTERLGKAIEKPYVHILFGARQTGKSTLLRTLLPSVDLLLDLSNPAERSAYLARPERLVEECRALATTRKNQKAPIQVVIDEAQTVPALFDAVQHLYDGAKSRYRFILSGSSARKLRVTGTNLLPGRAMLHHLYPLVLAERPMSDDDTRANKDVDVVLPLSAGVSAPRFPHASLLERLVYGDLPGITLAPASDRQEILRAYAYVYLEEELRREALIKDWPTFARFLRLAALESGRMINYAKLAKDAGTSAPTVKSHYQLLEDMFVGFRIDAFTGSKRKQVLETPRFFLFDLGVRHAAAELSNNEDTILADPGPVFEQWVGIELWKRLQYRRSGRLLYLRTKGGLEIDFILDLDGQIIPIETKWTEHPGPEDARHLTAFLKERPKKTSRGYIVCRCPRPRQITDQITAIPWWSI